MGVTTLGKEEHGGTPTLGKEIPGRAGRTGSGSWEEASSSSQLPLQKGTRKRSKERGGRAGSLSPSQSPSARHKAPVWRKKEVDPAAKTARKQWLADHALQPIQEQKEEAPLQKGGKEEKPLEKGVKEEAPLEKGDAQGSAVEPPLKKGDAEGSAVEPPLKKGDAVEPPLKKGHIMLDFHNVVEVRDKIPEGSHKAIIKLLARGIKVSICSWCYQNREKKVMEQLKKQEWFCKLEICFTTRDRVGGCSKGYWCQQLGIDALVDDSGDILDDALKHKIHIFPVLTHKNNHQWWVQQGGEAYTSLGPAVDAYLQWFEKA
eukprot:Skav204416  [mRNA]  locus=scaffold398:475832:476782:+ [translate_table: standard]